MSTDWHLPDPHFQPEFYRDIPLTRFLAFLIDTVLLLAISVLLVVLTLGLAALLILPTWWLLNFAYRAISLAHWSATPAMRFLAVEFRNADGTRFSQGDTFAHTLGFMLSFTFFPVQVISMILMATSPRAQGLTDTILGTVAINRRATGQ